MKSKISCEHNLTTTNPFECQENLSLSTAPQTLNSSIPFKGRVFDVRRDQLRYSDGRTSDFDLIAHPGAVVILAQHTDGSVVLVRQYRHVFQRELFEFPAGTLERDEDPLICAQRELAEETSFSATEWLELGVQFPTPGFCDEIQYCYLARGLEPVSGFHQDEDEAITVVTVGLAEIESAISKGIFVDAKSISLFCRARLRGLI